MLQKFKVVDSRGNYPGPGSYLAFSEFGMYISKKEAERRKAAVNEYEENQNKENKDKKQDKHQNQQTTKEETDPNHDDIHDEPQQRGYLHP